MFAAYGMPKFKLRVYWDTSVFFSWLKWGREASRTIDELAGLRHWEHEIRSGDVLMVSGENILRQEILAGAMPQDEAERFHALTRRRSVQLLPYDPRAEELAAKIREFYKKNREKTPRTPDAIHVAYALHYEVDEFHTYDGLLLDLNGSVAGRPLRICKPLVDQQVLFI